MAQWFLLPYTSTSPSQQKLYYMIGFDNSLLAKCKNGKFNKPSLILDAPTMYEAIQAAETAFPEIENIPYYAQVHIMSTPVEKIILSHVSEEVWKEFKKNYISQFIFLDKNVPLNPSDKTSYSYNSNNKISPYSVVRSLSMSGASNDNWGCQGTFDLQSGVYFHGLGYSLTISKSSSVLSSLYVKFYSYVFDEKFLQNGKINFKGIAQDDFSYFTLRFGASQIRSGRPYQYSSGVESTSQITVSDIQPLIDDLDGTSPQPLPPISGGDDPYGPGGYNKPPEGGGGIGGGGSFSTDNTPIPLPGLPTLSASGSGFVGLFNPSVSQLNSLAAYMWSTDFFDAVVKLFGDPADIILGLNIVPVKPATGESVEVKAGFVSTGVSMPVITSQYVQLDCGTVTVSEFWGSALDYSPYTQCQIYLPYIGTHQLDIDEIMGKTIHLIYNVDVLSGSCIAALAADDSTLYIFNGSCASAVPVTGQNFNTIISTAVQLAAGVGSFVASGGSMIGAAASGVENALTAAASGGMKPTIQHSGSVQATNGLLANQTPYLIFTIPTQSVPENQNQYEGYPSNMTLLLSNCSGYTKVREIHLVNIPCTESEFDEIESLLKGGVLI